MEVTHIARDAWQQSKRTDQPDYDDLVGPYADRLVARAEAVITTGDISSDGPFHSFENAVLGIVKSSGALKEIDDIQPIAVEVVSPTAEAEAVSTQQPPTTLTELVNKRGGMRLPDLKPPRPSKPKVAAKKAAVTTAKKAVVKVVKKAARPALKK